ncbi:MAG: hypothetical protein ACRBBO_05955 [Cognatishimia sp.]
MPLQDWGLGAKQAPIVSPPPLSFGTAYEAIAPSRATKSPLSFGGRYGLDSMSESTLPFSFGTSVSPGQSQAMNQRAPVGSRGAQGKINTALTDGKAGFVNLFSGFANAALESMGATPEPTHATVMPASFGRRNSVGMDNSTLVIVGLVAVGAYLAMKA